MMLFAGALGATEHPADKIVIAVPGEVQISAGRSTEFVVSVEVPANHHVYLKHANAKGKALPVQFSVSAASGFQISEKGRPRGVRAPRRRRWWWTAASRARSSLRRPARAAGIRRP